MANAATRTFEELLPTLRANYAYLSCGRQIMQDVFLWLVGVEDIPNVEKFLLDDQGWAPWRYRKAFTRTTREVFAHKGIQSADITALWKLLHEVQGFFNNRARSCNEIENLLWKIKDERNEIVHGLLLQVTHRNQEDIDTYFQSISTLVDDIITAFKFEYPGKSTLQMKSQLREFVDRTLNDVREGNPTAGNIQALVLYGGDAPTDIDDDDDDDEDEDEDTAFQDTSPEDIALDLMTLIRNYAGRNVNLVINNPRGGNVNIQNTGSNNTIHVANITGGQHNIRFG